MNQQTAIVQPNSVSMLRAMVGIGAICGLLIVVTFEVTFSRIETLKEQALQQAIFNVIPGITETKPYSYQTSGFKVSEEAESNVIYAGYDSQGELKGLAIEASGQGYADIIRILYGYDPVNQKVIGFYVLESKETPGLGDKIEKDPLFLSNFNQLDVALSQDMTGIEHEVVPVKHGAKENAWEVDGITGATISSRAIAKIINESANEWLPHIQMHKEDFMK